MDVRVRVARCKWADGGGAGFSAYGKRDLIRTRAHPGPSHPEMLITCFTATLSGQAGWARRARVINIVNNGNSVVTWKRLSDSALTVKDTQTLF